EDGKIPPDFFEEEEKLWKKVFSEYKMKTPVDTKNFEIEKYRVIMEHIKKARIIPYGIEVIFSYYLAREIELETVERITLGKFYNIETSLMNKWKFSPYQYGG
ncbi:V-type ATPase subunit, partial [bacterium]|nr:V-type ATPase subunit [bacterium]